MSELTDDELHFIKRVSGDYSADSKYHQASLNTQRELAEAIKLLKRYGAPLNIPRPRCAIAATESKRPDGYYWLRPIRSDGRWVIGEWDKSLGGNWIVIGDPGLKDESTFEVGPRIEKSNAT